MSEGTATAKVSVFELREVASGRIGHGDTKYHLHLLALAADEIECLQRLIARVVEWQPPFPVEASLLDELAAAAEGVSTSQPEVPR